MLRQEPKPVQEQAAELVPEQEPEHWEPACWEPVYWEPVYWEIRNRWSEWGQHCFWIPWNWIRRHRLNFLCRRSH